MDKFIFPTFQQIKLDHKVANFKSNCILMKNNDLGPSSNGSHRLQSEKKAYISSLQIETIDRDFSNIEDKSHSFLSNTGNKYFKISDNFSSISKSPHRVNLKGIQNIFQSIHRLNKIIEKKSKYGYEIQNTSISKKISSLIVENSKNSPIFFSDQNQKRLTQEINQNTYLVYLKRMICTIL